jgi:hypothetical protein
VGASAVLAALMVSSNASAFENSTHGPFYVQAMPLGMNFWYSPVQNTAWVGYHPDVEFGIHFAGRHDGPVVALRQAFLLSGFQARAGATTQLRYGYDIAIPVSDYELVIAPFGTVGLGYLFDGAPGLFGGPSAGLSMAWGAEGKFFFLNGLYAFARPFEMGFQCFHDSGQCSLAMVFGAGVGFAFPQPD